MRKRGVLWSTTLEWIVVAFAILLGLALIIVLSDKENSTFDFIKNLWRFG